MCLASLGAHESVCPAISPFLRQRGGGVEGRGKKRGHGGAFLCGGEYLGRRSELDRRRPRQRAGGLGTEKDKGRD